jgi:hypothetical protein
MAQKTQCPEYTEKKKKSSIRTTSLLSKTASYHYLKTYLNLKMCFCIVHVRLTIRERERERG